MTDITITLPREWSRANKAFRAAFLSLLTKMSFEDIKALQIIRESEYSHSAFYNSFTDKYDLADQIFLDEVKRFSLIVFEDIAKRGENLYVDNVFQPYIVLFEHVYRNRLLYSHIIHRSVPGWGTSVFAKKVAEFTEGFYNLQSSRIDLFEKVPFSFLSFLETKRQLSIVEYWEETGYKYSAEYLAEITSMINSHTLLAISLNPHEIVQEKRRKRND